MKTFKINKTLQVVCESKSTRSGFKHEATLLRNGIQVGFAKCIYYNRTWERFEFESVVLNLLSESWDLIEAKKQFKNLFTY